MNNKTRIEKDIKMFEGNIEKTKNINFTNSQKKIIELASQYYEDTKFYLKKGDLFTAFGCINYAHGLLDSVIKF
jgi:hypothetical protein